MKILDYFNEQDIVKFYKKSAMKSMIKIPD